MKIFLFTFDNSIIKHYYNNRIIDNNHCFSFLFNNKYFKFNVREIYPSQKYSVPLHQ